MCGVATYRLSRQPAEAARCGISCRRNEGAGGPGTRRDRLIWRRRVTLEHVARPGAGERVRHAGAIHVECGRLEAERLDDACLECAIEVGATDRLKELTEEDVVGVRVAVDLVGLPGRHISDVVEDLLDR